jgi:hypothetical protein
VTRDKEKKEKRKERDKEGRKRSCQCPVQSKGIQLGNPKGLGARW